MYPAYGDDTPRRPDRSTTTTRNTSHEVAPPPPPRRPFVISISFIVSAQVALAADPNQGPTNPTGFADLLPTPDLTHGDTRTLFEQYTPMAYGLDFDTGL